jgi:hypothetical protein
MFQLFVLELFLMMDAVEVVLREQKTLFVLLILRLLVVNY